MRELVVSLDALAALAQRTRPREPALVAAASLAELAGAESIRVGVNEDMRPIRETDLRDLRRATRRLELRITPAPALIKVALEAQPERVLLASDSREADGKPGPLDLREWGNGLAPAVRTLGEAGIAVSVLVASDFEAVKASHAASAAGVELYTGSIVDLPFAEREAELDGLANTSRLAAKLRMTVSLGGELGYRNVREVLESVPVADRVAVGRAWAWRCALVGVDRAARDLRALLG